MIGSLVVVDDVTTSFARFIADRAKGNRTGEFSLAFSGGSTARLCYEELARSFGTSIDWSIVVGWWGDERCVPLDDPDSNYRLVDEALLQNVVALSAVHPMRSDIPNPADHYDSLVAAAPPIDVIHLGLGPDGHTASLFPQSSALESAPDRLVVSNIDPLGTNPHERLTFTYAGIARCRTAVVTVAGAEKREALHRVHDGDRSAPAARLECEELIWLVDSAALGERRDR